MKNNKLGVPELKVMKDFEPVQATSLNLAPNDTLNYFRVHCNAKGLFTMYLYLNKKLSNQKTQITFSHDAIHWTDPIPVPEDLRKYMGGLIVKTDTRRGYFTDYCKQINTIAGNRVSQPYGPDTVFYGSIKLLETYLAVDAELFSDKNILKQNYPNPFNNITSIQFNIPENSFVTLKVFDASGKLATILVNEYKLSGKYESKFDASKLPGGIYFYTIQAGNFVKTRKMVVMK